MLRDAIGVEYYPVSSHVNQ